MSEAGFPIVGSGRVEQLKSEASSSAQCVVPSELAKPVVSQQSLSLTELLRWTVSFPAMLGASLVGAVFYVTRQFLVDPDSWWHIKTGQNILATHTWPTTDPYSFTAAGTHWLPMEWLGDVVVGWVEKAGGLLGLQMYLFLLAATILLAIYYYASLRSGNPKAGFVPAGLLCTLASASFNLRPQMLGYLFLVVTLILLEHFRRGRAGALWLLPPLFLLWINAHGSWIIGLAVIFVHWVSGWFDFHLGCIEAKRWSPKDRLRLEITFLLCLLMLALTPYGTGMAAYPLLMASSLPVGVANVLEWRPMPFNEDYGKLFLAVVLGFFLVQMAVRFRFRLAELLLLFGGIAMACLHTRFLLLFVPFFAPVFAVVVARWLAPYDRAKEKYLLNAVLMILVVAAIVKFFPTRQSLEQTVANRFPVKAVDYLRQHPVPEPMLNTYGFGGYLVFSRWPEHKVFIDGRGDVYELSGIFSDYLQMTGLKPKSFAVLKSYGIQSCLLYRDEPLAVVLSAMPGWQQVYSDDLSIAFIRRNPAAATGGTAAVAERRDP